MAKAAKKAARKKSPGKVEEAIAFAETEGRMRAIIVALSALPPDDTTACCVLTIGLVLMRRTGVSKADVERAVQKLLKTKAIGG